MKYIIVLMCVVSSFSTLLAHHGMEGSVGLNSSSNAGFTTLKKGGFYFETSHFNWMYQLMPMTSYAISNILNIKYAQAWNLQGMYGISDRLTVGVQSSWNQVSYTPLFGYDDTFEASTFSGSGDLSTFLCFRLWKKKQTEIAVLAGTEIPLGKAGEESGLVFTSVGSRSFDPFVGLVVSQQFKQLRIRNQFIYKKTTENQYGYYFGDVIANEFWLDYSFDKACCNESICIEPKKLTVNALAGFKYENLDQNRKNGYAILNTGYTRSFLSLGLRFGIKKKFFIPIMVDLPISENMTGIQNETNIRFQAGVSLLF
ncbi:hypothetical protein OAT71_02345 [Flavobacteriales bacterium]|nr:hypothetical protein [Flavobacteriales bacterium]